MVSQFGYTAAGAFTLTWDANGTPTPQDDVVGTDIGITAAFDLVANDTDPDGDALTISTFDSTSTEGGIVSTDPDPGQLIYEPPPGFTGADTFGYTVSDPGGATASAQVTVYVGVPIPDPSPIEVSSLAGRLRRGPARQDEDDVRHCHEHQPDRRRDCDALALTRRARAVHSLRHRHDVRLRRAAARRLLHSRDSILVLPRRGCRQPGDAEHPGW